MWISFTKVNKWCHTDWIWPLKGYKIIWANLSDLPSSRCSVEAKFSTGSEYRPDLQHQGKKPTCTTKQELRLKKNKSCWEKSCLAAFSQREQAFFVFKKRFLNIMSGEGTYRFPLLESLIKPTLHDPASFEHVSLTCKFKKGKKKQTLDKSYSKKNFEEKMLLAIRQSTTPLSSMITTKILSLTKKQQQTQSHLSKGL